MEAKKILVTGTFNSGKTQFVREASDIDIVTTERRITEPQDAQVKEETTVAMDYGQVRVGKRLLHLYGTPGQARFEFMWEILARDMDAFILLVDSEDRGSLIEVIHIMRVLRKRSKVPYLIAANKQDRRKALSPTEIARLLKVGKSVPVVSCIARDGQSVRRVLERTIELLT
ncbi:MAG: ADP-ribosylation factor-like protein [Chloroflexota bacterium]|nr:ADP-ribosylation factor-like protein [Chloroflexota bacterium]